MIAVELAKSTDVDLIEREKRAEVLEEIEFAFSDLADTTKQVEVGKMLATKYLVFGEIIDMDKEVLISLRMIDRSKGRAHNRSQDRPRQRGGPGISQQVTRKPLEV